MPRRVLAGVNELRRPLFGASLLAVQPLVLNLINLPAVAFIIRTLNDHAYGEWALALSLNTAAVIITNLGLRPFFVRRISEDPSCTNEAFRDQLGARSLLAVVAAAVSIGATLAFGYPMTVVLCTSVLAVGLIGVALTSCVADLLQAREELPALAAINMVSGLALTGTAVVATYAGFGAVGLAFSYLVGPVLSCILALRYVHRRNVPIAATLSIRRTLQLVNEARLLGSKVFVFTMGNQAENLLVPMAAGMAVFGQFAAATILIRRLEVIPDALCSAFYPHMARAWNDGRRSRLRLLAFIPVVLCLPPALVIFALADPIGGFLFPENPLTTAYVVRATVWYLPLIALAHGTGFALNAVHRDAQDAMILMSATVISLLTTPLLIWHLGLQGACISLLLRQALVGGLRLPLLLYASGGSGSDEDAMPILPVVLPSPSGQAGAVE